MYRSDGYRVSTDDPMYEIAAYVMDKRYDASNSIKQYIDYAPFQQYMIKCRKDGINMSHMSILVAAYLRVVSQNPYLNRFVMNKRIYARNHFCVSFVTLLPGKNRSTVNKVYFNLDDDVFTVNRKLTEAIEKCTAGTEKTAMDKLAKKLVRVPGLLTVAVSMFKFIDKHFFLPFSIVDASPFHTSLFVTNLASIRTGAVYHHLYEFGTTGVFVAMGQLMKRMVINGERAEERKFMEVGIVVDERIAEGHYYGRCFREIVKYIKDPSLLEEKPETIVRDPDIKAKNPKFIVK
ncbi:MAG: 2-oxo acid dehydrogenase subunit E2 [Anaerovoracaceae bacterium]